MKKTVVTCIFMLSILLIAPILTVIYSGENSAQSFVSFPSQNTGASSPSSASKYASTVQPSSAATAADCDEDKEYVLSLALQNSSEDFCDEALTAVISICKNNLNYHCNSNTKRDEINISQYSDEFYNRLESLYENSSICFSYKNEIVYIPMIKASSGNTISSEKHKYIQGVASPWDIYSDHFSKDAENLSGVSIFGLDYLCKNGLTAAEALKWYLPLLSIN